MTKLAGNEIHSTVSISIECKIRRTIYMYTSTPVSLPFWTKNSSQFCFKFVFEKGKVTGVFMHSKKAYGEVKA
jgi:hypothetical protein